MSIDSGKAPQTQSWSGEGVQVIVPDSAPVTQIVQDATLQASSEVEQEQPVEPEELADGS